MEFVEVLPPCISRESLQPKLAAEYSDNELYRPPSQQVDNSASRNWMPGGRGHVLERIDDEIPMAGFPGTLAEDATHFIGVLPVSQLRGGFHVYIAHGTKTEAKAKALENAYKQQFPDGPECVALTHNDVRNYAKGFNVRKDDGGILYSVAGMSVSVRGMCAVAHSPLAYNMKPVFAESHQAVLTCYACDREHRGIVTKGMLNSRVLSGDCNLRVTGENADIYCKCGTMIATHQGEWLVGPSGVLLNITTRYKLGRFAEQGFRKTKKEIAALMTMHQAADQDYLNKAQLNQVTKLLTGHSAAITGSRDGARRLPTKLLEILPLAKRDNEYVDLLNLLRSCYTFSAVNNNSLFAELLSAQTTQPAAVKKARLRNNRHTLALDLGRAQAEERLPAGYDAATRLHVQQRKRRKLINGVTMKIHYLGGTEVTEIKPGETYRQRINEVMDEGLLDYHEIYIDGVLQERNSVFRQHTGQSLHAKIRIL